MWRDVRSDGATPCPAGLRDDPGEVIAAARAAGLIYAQHIIALHAAITGQITPGPPGAARPDETAGPPENGQHPGSRDGAAGITCGVLRMRRVHPRRRVPLGPVIWPSMVRASCWIRGGRGT